MKKVLSLVLVLALVLGSFSFAFAFDDVAGQDCEKAVDTLVALGVVNGFDDGTFRPEKTVTRAQIAKMLVVALGYEDLISGTNSSFNDTAGHWADSYIAFAAGQGIVNGYPDGSFKPNATVSYDEAITMVVRALGYTDDALSGTWPTSYKIKALDLDITDDVKITTGGADRGGVAMLIYNALECNLVTINADNEVVESTTVVLDRIGDLVPELEVTPSVLDEDSTDYQLSDVNLSAYMYETLKVYTIDNEDNDAVVVYVSDTVTDTIVGEVDSVDGVNVVIEEADEDTYTFSTSGIAFYLNGAEVDGTDLADIETAVETNKLTATIKAVFEADEDGDYVVKNKIVQNAVGMVVTLATDAVQIENEYDEDDLDIDGIKLPVTTDEDNDDEEIVDLENLTIEGDATSLEDIKEDDIVTVFAADVKTGEKYPQAVKLVVTRSTMEGKVQKKKDSNTFVVDGETVDTSDYSTLSSDFTAIALGDEGTFYLDENGEILVFDGTSELENYAVVVGVKAGDLDTNFDQKSVDDFAQVKIATSEGETVVYDLYSDYDEDATTKFESFKLKDTETDATVLSDITINVDASITPGALVKYDLNSAGQIDELEIVTTVPETLQVSGTKLGNKYRFTNDTIIFDATDGDYEIIALDDIVEDTDLDVEIIKVTDSTFGNLEVIIVPAEGVSSSNDGTYAVILDADVTLDSDDDTVQELSLLIDGVEKTYLTDDETDASTDQVKDFHFNLYELTIDGGVVTDVDDIIASATYVIYGDAYNDVTVQAIDANDQIVRFNETNYSISDDAVVYVAEYDDSDADWTVEAGDLSDIDEEDFIKAYNLDADDKDEDGLDVIFVFTGDLDKLPK